MLNNDFLRPTRSVELCVCVCVELNRQTVKFGTTSSPSSDARRIDRRFRRRLAVKYEMICVVFMSLARAPSARSRT